MQNDAYECVLDLSRTETSQAETNDLDHERMLSACNQLALPTRLMSPDWSQLGTQQARRVDKLIKEGLNTKGPQRILDVACGTGALAIALAEMGYEVTGVDISSTAIAIARREARQRGLDVRFEIGDMHNLTALVARDFDAVTCLGNSVAALPRPDDLLCALSQMRLALRSDGVLVAGMRDYAPAMKQRPLRIDPPMLASMISNTGVSYTSCGIGQTRHITSLTYT
jgi:glycine/sarcosine N-methyltransferase